MEKTRGSDLNINTSCLIGAVILIIFALTALAIVWVVRDTITRTIQPVQDLSLGLGTRVAEVLNPTPTIIPDPVTIIHSVRDLARLETSQYTIEKVITAETGQSGVLGSLFGDRLIFVAHGTVIAGVDLQKMGPDDLRLQNGVLYVDLPEAEVFIATLDNDESYVYDRETGLLNQGEIDLETNARQAAQQEILEAALEDGILEIAQVNAENYLYRLLRDLGYPEVIFVDSANPTPLPMETPAAVSTPEPAATPSPAVTP